MTETWTPPLPDPADWTPRAERDNLRDALRRRCLGIEKLVRLRSQLEREMNIDNFDSGLGVEDIVREQLRLLFPSRYGVRSGVVNDSEGRTVGECDVLLLNESWFPSIKAGATAESRRLHFPVEATYGVIEVKQSLDAAALDAAMAKLVTVSRLRREAAPKLLVENRDAHLIGDHNMQPIFKAVIATDLRPGEDFEDLVHRFVALNGQVRRREVITALCVLGHGFASWSIASEDGPPQLAYFDGVEETEHLRPVLLHTGPDATDSALYELFTLALGYMSSMVLPIDDVAVKYGAPQRVQHPTTATWDLHPDGCTCWDTAH
ncbi:DUF6602 domain-containing protein [Cellulomonas sp.]|uniref:DUF6602 domain-containing protein n=1 Tax=Cellulomonas sp. TaxID=40001 RepID=UPI0025849135|nr:DUF6602 domain-containing protein [Cellulomonas sp.]MCR6688114.1 hypothetical protein [Cellulomonas sp.]